MTRVCATETVDCPGCGLRSPLSEGPTHPHIRSSPGCWATFGEVLACEFADPAYFSLHQVTVDTYAASHPGEPNRRATQAVGLHLMTLQRFVEDGMDASDGPRLHRRMVQRLPELRWLAPPEVRGGTTVAEHLLVVRGWAEEVWARWATHHATVRDWIRRSLR